MFWVQASQSIGAFLCSLHVLLMPVWAFSGELPSTVPKHTD